MKSLLGAQCDDFHASTRMFFKMELSLEREAAMHFFERVRREFPAMRRFRRRDENALILEENDAEARAESQRWVRLETGSLRWGNFAPRTQEECNHFSRFILDQAPCHLTLTDLDLDYMEVVYGFDMEYCGNHDQLIAETLYREHPLAALLLGEDAAHTVDCQPYFGIALSPNCDMQAHLEIKSRTTSYEVRTGEYESQLLSVNLSVRRYWGFDDNRDLMQIHKRMTEAAADLAVARVVPLVVNPLALAITNRP
jgi:hypothetical protein